MTTIVACLVALTAGAAAQTGTIHGTVHDPNGAAVPNAVVSIQPAASTSGSKAVAITDAKGEFRIKQPPGKWRVCVTATGFALQCDALDLARTGSIDYKITLQVAPLGNAIPVQAGEDNPLLLYTGQSASTARMSDTA